MDPMGSEESHQQSPQKSESSPAKTTEMDVTSSHASGDGACVSSSKKSRSISNLKKLPTQVGVDSSGAIRIDFPFKNISSRNKLKELTYNTLFSTVPLKKRKVDEWAAKQTSSESLTTSGDVSFVFGKTHHNTYSYVGDTEKSEDVSTTDLENSS